VIFDVAGPLAAYYGLRSAGVSTVGALILSGIPPAFGIGLGVVRRGHIDAIGILVLLGIVVGSVLGLASNDPHLVLIDGTVPTFVFGVVCIGSLWSSRPMIYRFALEAIGSDTAKGRDFADRWRYEGFRRAFRVTTVVWGLSFLVEAVVQVAIIQTASAGTAKTTSNLLPLLVAGAVIAWNISYAKRGRRQAGLAAEAARARGDAPPPMPD
jgi:hypothetical protein